MARRVAGIAQGRRRARHRRGDAPAESRHLRAGGVAGRRDGELRRRRRRAAGPRHAVRRQPRHRPRRAPATRDSARARRPRRRGLLLLRRRRGVRDRRCRGVLREAPRRDGHRRDAGLRFRVRSDRRPTPDPDLVLRLGRRRGHGQARDVVAAAVGGLQRRCRRDYSSRLPRFYHCENTAHMDYVQTQGRGVFLSQQEEAGPRQRFGGPTGDRSIDRNLDRVLSIPKWRNARPAPSADTSRTSRGRTCRSCDRARPWSRRAAPGASARRAGRRAR
mmetsp:Transcript_2326/g.8913  ORF Transcript_2326/g.8913 Transcript_2326/m.8913 type:complete len:275 (-) Transcript_2326:365-1189(-)